MKNQERHEIEKLFIPQKPKYWIGYPKYFIHLIALTFVIAVIKKWYDDMQLKKTLFILLLLSKMAVGQITPIVPLENVRFEPFRYPDKISSKIIVEQFPDFLLDKVVKMGTGRKATNWTFASKSEFEEIRGGKVESFGGKYYFPIKVICHDYAKPNEKFMFDLVFTFIDGREGLIFENFVTNTAQKIN